MRSSAVPLHVNDVPAKHAMAAPNSKKMPMAVMPRGGRGFTVSVEGLMR